MTTVLKEDIDLIVTISSLCVYVLNLLILHTHIYTHIYTHTHVFHLKIEKADRKYGSTDRVLTTQT